MNSTLDDVKLRAAAQEVVTALEYAQTLAVTTGTPHKVAVVPGVDRVRVKRWTTLVKVTGEDTFIRRADLEGGTFELIGHPLNRGTDYVVKFNDDDRLGGVDIVSSDFGGSERVVFEALGIPKAGGTVVLSLGKAMMTVNLHAVTGKVTLTE